MSSPINLQPFATFAEPPAPLPLAPVLFALPCGASLGGVPQWTLAAARVLASLGHSVGVILHAPRANDIPVSITWPQGVRIFDLTHEPPLEGTHRDTGSRLDDAAWDRIAAAYAGAIDSMHAAQSDPFDQRPVVCIPSLLGDCYGVFARVSHTHAPRMRVAALVHSPVVYDRAIASHYAPLCAAFAAVSPATALQLRDRLAINEGVVAEPHIIEASAEALGATLQAVPTRESGAGKRRSLRLAYVGRLDARVKGVMALPHVAQTLASMNVRHRVAIVGDGPDLGALKASFSSLPTRVQFLGTKHRAQAIQTLRWADAVLLPSRYEGLSLTLLEALACGCVPIGTVGALGHGPTALIRDASEGIVVAEPPHPTSDADRDRLVGVSMACAIAGALGRPSPRTPTHLSRMSRNCVLLAQSRYTTPRFAHALAAFVESAAAANALTWPQERPWRFAQFDPTWGSGSTPAAAPERMDAILRRLASSRVAILGTGQHTLDLLPTIARHACVAAFLDEDPARTNTTLADLPVLSPQHAAEHAITDVVISSWLYHAPILARAASFAAMGLRLHALYDNNLAPAGSSAA